MYSVDGGLELFENRESFTVSVTAPPRQVHSPLSPSIVTALSLASHYCLAADRTSDIQQIRRHPLLPSTGHLWRSHPITAAAVWYVVTLTLSFTRLSAIDLTVGLCVLQDRRSGSERRDCLPLLVSRWLTCRWRLSRPKWKRSSVLMHLVCWYMLSCTQIWRCNTLFTLVPTSCSMYDLTNGSEHYTWCLVPLLERLSYSDFSLTVVFQYWHTAIHTVCFRGSHIAVCEPIGQSVPADVVVPGSQLPPVRTRYEADHRDRRPHPPRRGLSHQGRLQPAQDDRRCQHCWKGHLLFISWSRCQCMAVSVH